MLFIFYIFASIVYLYVSPPASFCFCEAGRGARVRSPSPPSTRSALDSLTVQQKTRCAPNGCNFCRDSSLHRQCRTIAEVNPSAAARRPSLQIKKKGRKQQQQQQQKSLAGWLGHRIAQPSPPSLPSAHRNLRLEEKKKKRKNNTPGYEWWAFPSLMNWAGKCRRPRRLSRHCFKMADFHWVLSRNLALYFCHE